MPLFAYRLANVNTGEFRARDQRGIPLSTTRRRLLMASLEVDETRYAVRRPLSSVLDAVGDTPLIEFSRYLSRSDIRLFGKLEACNPGGSAKDRSAGRMLADAIEAGQIASSTTVVESTSGNLGVGLAQTCRYYGLDLVCVVDTRANETNIRKMRALGADVRVVTEPDPETGDLLTARINLVNAICAATPDSFWLDQYANESNPAAHDAGTMREIDEALDGDIDYLFVATSTTGTLRGCAEYLKRNDRRTTVVAVDALGSALFGGAKGRRRLPGLGAGIETPLSRQASFDELVRVSDLECVVGCRRLAAREAVLAGASSGGVLAAVERIEPLMEPGSRCAAILADGGGGYLETVFDDAWVAGELRCEPSDLARLVAATNRSERCA
jgi:2,3-diaminopropionate biosynthesis protein SbnA